MENGFLVEGIQGMPAIPDPAGSADFASLHALRKRLTVEGIVEEHGEFIRSTLASLGAPTDELDDIAQEVLSAVYLGLPAFDPAKAARPQHAVHAWLFGICKRQVANDRRRRCRRVEAFRRIRRLDSVRDTSRSAEDWLLDRERVAALEHVLEKIAPARRAILVGHVLHGIPMEDVAHEHGIPVNTAWDRLRRARVDVKAALRKKDTLKGCSPVANGTLTQRIQRMKAIPDPAGSTDFVSLRVLRKKFSGGGLPAERRPEGDARLAAFCVLKAFLELLLEFSRRIQRGEHVRLVSREQPSIPGRMALEVVIEPASIPKGSES